MAHHRYQTEAIILMSVPRGESDRFFALFTGELGLVMATAQSARSLSSKLRFGLRDFSVIRADLIRTDDSWRIVDAEEIPGAALLSAPEAARSFAEMCRLTRRLLAGQRVERALFFALLECRHMLATKYLSSEDRRAVKTAMALKTLHELGYGGAEEAACARHPFSEETLAHVRKHGISLGIRIRAALRATHL